MGNSLPLETITSAIKQVPPPDEAIKDKIIFVFNNVSKQNMEGKVNELKALLGTSREAWQYLAQHLVVHRASIEPNFHVLYLDFLNARAGDDGRHRFEAVGGARLAGRLQGRTRCAPALAERTQAA
jgi:hypothetical protein